MLQIYTNILYFPNFYLDKLDIAYLFIIYAPISCYCLTTADQS